MPASLRIEIFPSDMQRCLDFYVGVLGFQIRKRQGTYAFFARGSIYIGAVEVPSSDTRVEKEAYRRPTKGIELVLEVDDLRGERDKILSHGLDLETDIQEQEWGLEDFRLVDPDGYCKYT